MLMNTFHFHFHLSNWQGVHPVWAISFFCLNTILYFLILMKNWQFQLSNWQEVSPMWAIYFVCLHWIICLSILQSHNFNLNYCLKSSLLLAFCCLFVWLIKCTPHPSHHQDCFRGSLCYIHSVNPCYL